MKKIVLILLSLLLVEQINAQISVERFSVSENDLDARNYPVLDDEGIACALVKIITTAKEFNFEIGQLPVMKIDDSKVGEIWVYVPDGTMKMKITHADLGSLKGAGVEDGFFMFPHRLKRAQCYRMELTHKEVTKVIGSQDPGNLTFQFNMEGCEVFLGEKEKSQGVIEGKTFSITWPKGQSVKYRIHKDRYEDVTGTITVNETTNVPIVLKPLFATVNITSIPGATIYIDDKKCGVGNILVELNPGFYNFKAVKDGYHDTIKSINLSREDTLNLFLKPDLIYGSVNITSSPSNATIYIDGNDMGNTPKIITHLDVGKHQLELKKSQYISVRKTITIIGDQTININEQFTTKVSVQRLKDKAGKNQFGFHICADFISSNSLVFGIEGYFPKALGLTFELGGFYGFVKTDECYWYDNKSGLIGSATYTPIGSYLNVGIGVKTGIHFRITPYIGMKNTVLISSWNNIGYSSEDPAKNSNAIGAVVGSKFLYLINEHFQVSVAPNYSFGVSKSKGYNLLSSQQPVVKNVLEGFNVKCGVSYIF